MHLVLFLQILEGHGSPLATPLYDPPANHRRTYSTVVPPVRARANQSSSIFIPLQRENIHTHEEAKGAHYIYHTYVRVYTSYLVSEEHCHERNWNDTKFWWFQTLIWPMLIEWYPTKCCLPRDNTDSKNKTGREHMRNFGESREISVRDGTFLSSERLC